MGSAAVAVVAALIAVHCTAHAAEARARSHPRQRGRSLKSDLSFDRAANTQLGMTRGIRATVCTQALDAQLRLRGIPQVLCDACAQTCWSFARRRRLAYFIV
jgi:predicted acylesterase/phospholipase RssA